MIQERDVFLLNSNVWSRPIVAIWLFFDADFQLDFERHIESSYPFYTENVKNVGHIKHRSTDRENNSRSSGEMRRLSQKYGGEPHPPYRHRIWALP